MLEKRTSQSAFIDTKSFRDSRQVPNWLHSELRDREFASCVETNLAIRYQSTRLDTLLKFRDLHVCFGNGNGRSYVDVFLLNDILEKPRRKMTCQVSVQLACFQCGNGKATI